MRKQALGLIILLGTVSFFAVITYEDVRSITGQYLALKGATAIAIGVVSGFGELFGFCLTKTSILK